MITNEVLNDQKVITILDDDSKIEDVKIYFEDDKLYIEQYPMNAEKLVDICHDSGIKVEDITVEEFPDIIEISYDMLNKLLIAFQLPEGVYDSKFIKNFKSKEK